MEEKIKELQRETERQRQIIINQTALIEKIITMLSDGALPEEYFNLLAEIGHCRY